MIKSRPQLPQTAEEFLKTLDRSAFIATRKDNNPENWDFQVGYYEAAGNKAHRPDSDDWFVLAIYKPSITDWLVDQKQASVSILKPDLSPSSCGHGHQDKDGIWMWDTD